MADARVLVAVLRECISHAESDGYAVSLRLDDARAIIAALERGREVEEAVEAMSVAHVSVRPYGGRHGIAREDDVACGGTWHHAADALLAWAWEQKGKR